jgi:L-alanine-DL-glutamate epimerase-like enolase superfamily enzyme
MIEAATAPPAMSGPPGREAPIANVSVSSYRIPTDQPEEDGTYSWSSTTLVVVEANAGGMVGLGYTYADASIVALIRDHLFEAIKHYDAHDPPAAWRAMTVAVRNLGRDGLAATAISALDTALWDLKAKLLDQPLVMLFGRYRDDVPIYGSGGFTSYSDHDLQDQLARWVNVDGCDWVKMKVGTHPEQDGHRVKIAKSAIDDRALFVDANGAFAPRQALCFAERFAAEADVRWFEEPVSSDDLEGLAQIRARAPAQMDIAAGEYGYDIDYFRTMLASGAVDVQQADVTRCGGFTGFLQVAALCEAHHIPISGHCAPALHLPVACAAPRLRHLEWFHDHVRIEHMLFDGAPRPREGRIRPDLSRPGHGLEFKVKDAQQFRIA